MFTTKTRRSALITFSILTMLGAVAVPAAAHAEMTDPPACTLDPWGGCQSGPLGNGTGGGVWGPSPDLSAFDTGVSVGTGWSYARLDGQQATYSDAETIRVGYDHSYCIPYGPSVVCL